MNPGSPQKPNAQSTKLSGKNGSEYSKRRGILDKIRCRKKRIERPGDGGAPAMILQRRNRGLAVFHGILQILLIEMLFMVLPQWHDFALVVRHGIHGMSNYGLYALVIALSLLLDTARSLARNLPVLRLGVFEVLRRSGRQLFTVFVGLLVFLVLTKDTTISRS